MLGTNKFGNHILLGFDDKNLLPALVLLWSLRPLLSVRVTVTYFESDLSPNSISYLASTLEKLGMKFSLESLDASTNLTGDRHITRSAFLRLFAASRSDLIPFTWMDTDMICLDARSLEHFLLHSQLASGDALVVAERQNGTAYFNSGFLTINKAISELGAWLEAKDALRDLDQSVLNDNFPSPIRVNHNFNALANDYSSPPRATVNLHYAGNYKPWHLPRNLWKNCLSTSCPWSMWFAMFEELESWSSQFELDENLRLYLAESERDRPNALGIRANLAIAQILGAGARRLVSSLVPAKYLLHPNHGFGAK